MKPQSSNFIGIRRGAVLLLAAAAVTAGCERRSAQPNIELVQNMMKSPAIKAQGEDLTVEDLRGNLIPPEGTLPRGYKPYTFTDPNVAEKELKNPYAKGQPMATRISESDLLAKGQKQFSIYCAVCHGPLGHGDGTVADKLQLPPPSLISKRVRDWKDGYIYHMVVAGRGLMGGYGYQIPSEEDRWALVNYVRHLQSTQPVFPNEQGGK